MARINRAVELLEQGQPIYYTGAEERTFEGGVRAAGTWADYITFEMEHGPFDITALHNFMRGMKEAGPTRSGHPTPAVIVTLPMTGVNEQVVEANAWQVTQVLAAGVHGILLCHAESPAAVRRFVETARYSYQKLGIGDVLGEGRRGNGGQAWASKIWGISGDEYLERADVWPLNPNGELLLGLKIENRRALENAEESTKVPGIGFAEWGPGDMGMSFGYANQHDEPYPPEMIAARSRVLAACKAAKIAFLNTVSPQDVVERIQEGVMVCAGRHGQAAAEIGRQYSGRTMPV
jgi:4-hydroxy-2-oxoheptanedioate aldolase